MSKLYDFVPLYGDIHNHCGISYGHGPLSDALANARERLDFVSVTGHAHWPDMPEAIPRRKATIEYHLKGFAKLKAGWSAMMEELREKNEEGEFVIFPAFEVHFCATGDRNILYKGLEGEILYPSDLMDLNEQLRELRHRGFDTLAQPHHIGYKKGTRGIDWSSFDPEFAPVVELISMHGCSEGSDNTHPFLHDMGPSDWEGTVQYGLHQGNVFGVTGGTDHHSGHPGSYGHGLTGVWAESCERKAIWAAFYDRRTWAMTGDKIQLRFLLNDQPMGSVVSSKGSRDIKIEVQAGGAIDYIDILKNNRLLHRVSECDLKPKAVKETLLTKLFLELGWGPKGKVFPWEAEFGISDGVVLDVEPRFRGKQVVSPLDAKDGETRFHSSHVVDKNDTSVCFVTETEGNPNTFTNTSQGMCLEVEMPQEASVYAVLNGQRFEWPLKDVLEGARSGLMDGLGSSGWRLNQAALPHELKAQIEFTDPSGEKGDQYYVRVRQKNDQWAWSSPIFCRD